MKRPTEAQLEFPLLSITYDPLAENVVILEMQMDWGLTGEVQLKYMTVQSLRDMNHVLQHAQNYVADELVRRGRAERRAAERKNAPPF